MTRTVVHYTDTDTFGGAERAMVHVMAGLDPERWRPLLFHHGTPGLRPVLEQARARGIATRVVPPIRGVTGLRHLPALRRALREAEAALFHAHMNWPLACTGGLLAARLCRVRTVATVQLFGPLPDRTSVDVLRRLAPHLVDRYVAVSSSVGERLRCALRLPPGAVRVVPNTIDPAPFLSAGPAEEPERSPSSDAAGRPVVLCVARLEEQKGHRYLIEAATHVPDALFVLAGEGPERTALEAQAARHGVAERVRFLGHRDDVPALLRACTVFVLPSLYEGLPLSVLEAMAARTPVIATAVDGTPEAVQDGSTGLLVPPGHPEALAAALRRLLGDPAYARRLATAGHERLLREFTARRGVQRVSAVYDEVLARGT